MWHLYQTFHMIFYKNVSHIHMWTHPIVVELLIFFTRVILPYSHVHKDTIVW